MLPLTALAAIRRWASAARLRGSARSKNGLIHALYTHQRHLPPKVRAFIDFLAARFAPDCAWDAAH